MRKISIFVILLCIISSLLPGHPIRAQTTARGRIEGYNERTEALILNLNNSDLRYHQIGLNGGILSISIEGTTHEAYLLNSEMTWTEGDLRLALKTVGYDVPEDENPLVLISGRTSSLLLHIDRTTNPRRLFNNATTGDEVWVNSVAPAPDPMPVTLTTSISLVYGFNLMFTRLNPGEALVQGLFPGMRGTVTINGKSKTFLMAEAENLPQTSFAEAYLYAVTPPESLINLTGEGEFLVIASGNGTDDSRADDSLAAFFEASVNHEVSITFNTFNYEDTSPGQITGFEPDGQTLWIDIPGSYLDSLNLTIGDYVLITINGHLRTAMIMDVEMFAAAQTRYGLKSGYILVPDGNSMALIYMLEDGRTIQSIFQAQTGDKVRIRRTKVSDIDILIAPEVIVKAIIEVSPEGYFYTDITPYELSFLEVLVGQHVNVEINGIEYRAMVVDEELIRTVTRRQEDVLVYPTGNTTIITHTERNSVTAEARFQVSVGDPVIIKRAPN